MKPMECNNKKVLEKKMQFLLKSHQNPGSSKNQNHCRESITWPPRDSRDIIRDAKLHFDFFLFVCSNSMQFLIKHIPVSSSQPNPILNDRNTVLFTREAIRYHWHEYRYSFDFSANFSIRDEPTGSKNSPDAFPTFWSMVDRSPNQWRNK